MEAEEIKKLRKLLGLNQTQLADKLGVTKTTVLNWEHKLTRPSKLALRQLNRLSTALDDLTKV